VSSRQCVSLWWYINASKLLIVIDIKERSLNTKLRDDRVGVPDPPFLSSRQCVGRDLFHIRCYVNVSKLLLVIDIKERSLTKHFRDDRVWNP